MTDFFAKSANLNVTTFEMANRTWSAGQLMVPARTDTSTNVAVAQKYVWSVTTPGTSTATPTWPASVTPGTTTVTEAGGVVWTAQEMTSWANATPFVGYAAKRAGAGDRIFVPNNHLEQSNNTINTVFPLLGTAASPIELLSVVEATPPTTLSAGAEIQQTSNVNCGISYGFGYIYGVTFNCTLSGFSSANINIANDFNQRQSGLYFDACTFKQTSAGSQFLIGANAGATNSQDSWVHWRNCKVGWPSTSMSIEVLNTRFTWEDDGGNSSPFLTTPYVLPTTLFKSASTTGMHVEITVRNADLSQITGNLIDASASGLFGHARFEQCKLGSGVVIATGTIAGPVGLMVDLDRCDSGTDNERDEQYRYQGTVRTETTIVRTSGASDGTTAFSRKLVTNANASILRPLVSQPILFWNDTTAVSKTATVEIVNDGSTLTNADIWLELDYLGSSASPIASKVTDKVADVLTTAANQATSTAGWTTTGLTSPVKQKLSATFTPQMKGLLVARVCLAKASQTVYVDPVLTVV